MTLRSSLLPAVRRFAAGIDISQREVRLVVLGQRVRAGLPVRVEFIAAAPLFAGAMAGAEIVNRSAVGSALREVFAQLPHECSAHALRCAMAMPASATLTTSVPLTQLASPRQSAMNSHALAALEPAVMAEAERVAGIERHALAVDWFIDEAPRHAGCVTIADQSQRYAYAGACRGGVMTPIKAVRCAICCASFAATIARASLPPLPEHMPLDDTLAQYGVPPLPGGVLASVPDDAAAARGEPTRNDSRQNDAGADAPARPVTRVDDSPRETLEGPPVPLAPPQRMSTAPTAGEDDNPESSKPITLDFQRAELGAVLKTRSHNSPG